MHSDVRVVVSSYWSCRIPPIVRSLCLRSSWFSAWQLCAFFHKTSPVPCYVFFWKKPESGISTSYLAIRRYTKVHLGFCLRFSTLIGQIGRVPLFGAGPRRYIRSGLFRLAVTAFWRALTASWRQKKESRSFLGPFARQNCLRILRP